jgi:hypothetical protein
LDEQRERKLTLVLSETSISLGRLARTGAPAGPSNERAVPDAADRVRDGPGRQCSAGMLVHDPKDGEYCFRTAVPMSTTKLTLLRPDLIDHARPARFLATPNLRQHASSSYSLPDKLLGLTERPARPSTPCSATTHACEDAQGRSGHFLAATGGS